MAIAIHEEAPLTLSNLQPLWHDSAPRRLADSPTANDPVAAWKAWQEHLQDRRGHKAPRFLDQKNPPLLWGWPLEWEREEIATAIDSPTTLAELVIGDDLTATPDLAMSLQMVALAYALPELAPELPAETWWFLVERLHTIATQAAAQRIDWQSNPDDVVRNQLLAGELPFALGYLFPEIRALHDLRDEARVAFSDALIEITDGQGLPHAKLLPLLGPLFACWTRARWLGDNLKRGCWSRAAERQYEWLVRHAIRLADDDGRFLFSHAEPSSMLRGRKTATSWCKPLFKTALKLAGDRSDHAAARATLPRGSVPTCHKLSRKHLPAPSLNSDWACVTIMADGWSQSAARLATTYVDYPQSLELSVDGEKLFAGNWTFTTKVAGQLAEPEGEWEQLCWESGKRFDFIELGLPLSHGLRLERQILFGRQDRVLYFADIIFPTDGEPRDLEHTFNLPLASGTVWTPENETRDGILSGTRTRAAILPLALREWRADPRSGALTVGDGRLTLAQSGRGKSLCCPLFIDLDRDRAAQQRTWRQLTVCDMLEVVPPDVAVGFRAQSGNDQWLIYRSIKQPGNRSVLGHNVAGEFCAGRVVDGAFKEWIEIEPV